MHVFKKHQDELQNENLDMSAAEKSRFGYWAKADSELCERLVERYVVRGSLKVAMAFQENPEWSEQLLANHNMPQIYQKCYAIRKRIAKQPKMPSVVPASNGNGVTALVVRPRKSLAGLMAATTGAERGKVVHCPHCGESIELWQKVAEVIFGSATEMQHA